MAEQSSSVAATDPGPSRRRTQAGAVELRCSFRSSRQTRSVCTVLDCLHIPSHPHGIHHLIGAVGAQSPSSLPPSLGSSSSFLSNASKHHLQHIAGFHSHTLPTHDVARQGPKPPHASDGVGRDKVGKERRRRVIVSREDPA
jgi:hypothetical protein